MNKKRGIREIMIIEYCKDKEVLHLGCADAPNTAEGIASGTLLHKTICFAARETFGIDIDQNGIEILQAHGYGNLFCTDIECLKNNPFGRTFDIIVAGEIIEHVGNVGTCFEKIQLFMDDDSMILLTVPNAFSLRRFLRVIFGIEYVHHDHLYYFSVATIEHLCSRYGYEIEEYYFCLGGNRSIVRRILVYPLELLIRYVLPQCSDGLMFIVKRQKK